MQEYAVKLNNVSKRLSSSKTTFELRDVSFELQFSAITTMIGLNGAGKTTIVKLILELLQPDSGKIELNDKIKNNGIKRIGYLPESFSIGNSDITAKNFISFFCELNKIPIKDIPAASDFALEKVGLTKYKNEKISRFSKGMKTRLGLAQAIIAEPFLLVLDEPTDGLDPKGRHEIIDLLDEIKSQKKSVFVTSHVLSEVENISDSVIIIDNGKILLNGRLNELLDIEQGGSLEKLFFNTIDNPRQG